MRVWLVVKDEQIFHDGIPTGEFMPPEYEGVFASQMDAIATCQELANAYFADADYVSEIYGNGGVYAERRVDDEYVFWKEYKVEPVESYL